MSEVPKGVRENEQTKISVVELCPEDDTLIPQTVPGIATVAIPEADGQL
jgi:hypothetical protein